MVVLNDGTISVKVLDEAGADRHDGAMARPKNSKTEHGTQTCYSYGCRRPECRQAHTDYIRERMQASRMERKTRLVPMGRFPMDCSDAIDEIALILGSE